MDPEKRRRIFDRIPHIRETILTQHHREIFFVNLARAIAGGDGEEVLAVLEAHPLARKEVFQKDGQLKKSAAVLIKFLEEFRTGILPLLRVDERLELQPDANYEQRKQELLRAYLPRLAIGAPHTAESLATAIKILPDVVAGKERKDVFAPRIAWIGGNGHDAGNGKPRRTPGPPGMPRSGNERAAGLTPEGPGRIALVLSGGSAKGIFYIGFLRALMEEGIWPDIVVGASAGAIAGAALATGKGAEHIEKALSLGVLRKIFSAWRAPVTFLLSFGSGIIGHGLARHLRKLLGNAKCSEMADVFVVGTIQRPFSFGKTVIGRGSSLNGDLELSSDIELWRAVTGSAAMQGIIPPAVLKRFRAERLERSENGAQRPTVNLPYAIMEDGAAVEYLPIATADLLLRRLGESSLIVAVNLANLNPMRLELPDYHYLSLRERIAMEEENLQMYSLRYKKPWAIVRAVWGWFGQQRHRIVQNLAPMRAFGAFEAVYNHNIVQTMEAVQNGGPKILVNANADGALDRITLTGFADAKDIIAYGYDTGKEVMRLLVGEGTAQKPEPRKSNTAAESGGKLDAAE